MMRCARRKPFPGLCHVVHLCEFAMTTQTRDSVETAIRNSPLQLNPVVEGEEILVRVPR